MSNRLKNEKSPYLLQHADNPVDWFPWSEQAFEEAEKRDCPVFLSIGYATCHWCHVMEHESFEDEEVAELMNDAFVSIKVDREERPDIDNTYMTICQMLTGQGGWPMTIIMTPEKQPFFAATYLPKHSRGRQPGMMDLIPQINEVWQQDRERVTNSIKQIKNGFSKTLELSRADDPLSPEVVNKAIQTLKSSFDEVHGGFSNAPKFPSPQNLLFLLRHAEHQNNQEALGMVEKTLTEMRMGGIWDHLGGGFHRYATDAQWLLPHFEKMLYDQAMLMMSYAEAWRITQKPLYKKTCDQIFHYLDSRMKSPEGGFYSAEDADSEGEEGKYYVWSYDEIHEILSDEDAALFCDLFEIQKSGNFRDESTRELTGKNIPHLATSIADYAAKQDTDEQDLNERIQKIRNSLLKAREQRPAPLLDDKILADWNGLLMAALASAGAMLKESKYVNAAKGIETFITNHLTKNDGSLMHRFRDGDAAIDGMADDYAAMIWGYIELYQATFEPEYLSKAVQLQKVFEQQFLDVEYGGFYFTSANTEAPLGRQKEIYDGALPSSNSIAALNGFRLARLTGEMQYEYQVENLFKAFSAMINQTPSGYTFALLPMLLMDHHPSEIVVTCKDDDSQKQTIIEYLRSLDRFHNSVILKTGSVAESIGEISEFTQQFPIKDKPSVYVCQNFACKTPVHSLDELRRLMEDTGT